ncbi:50S ribosomal protein L2 [Candidatus Pacearchaeota archaeon CG10_big_fil_rev_8_21_14_0_10_31_24]|nr:MAG: 50S ribosomal protein L2 [Candidatus Pacearchaeota archaeon CG10_big_fil_rev_8_21_14_0_10_31_24]
MGKRIISQARGKGSLTYRVRKKAFVYKISYPMHDGEAEILKILHSAAHSAPLMKIKIQNEIFFNPAFHGAIQGEKIIIGDSSKIGNISMIKNIEVGSKIYNIENNPGDGGKMIRAAGMFATLLKKLDHNKVLILMPNKKEVTVSGDCRATLGVVAGEGKGLKPFIKAGVKYYKMAARNKLWPRTSAVKMNAIDHPFGSGRGKRPKSKIAKRNAPPGRRVGHLRPRRTGRKR